MTVLLEKPEELKVTTNVEGTPLVVTRSGKTERVACIYKQWQANEQIVSQESQKTFFLIKTTRGTCDIYRDARSNLWYLSKIYD